MPIYLIPADVRRLREPVYNASDGGVNGRRLYYPKDGAGLLQIPIRDAFEKWITYEGVGFFVGSPTKKLSRSTFSCKPEIVQVQSVIFAGNVTEAHQVFSTFAGCQTGKAGAEGTQALRVSIQAPIVELPRCVHMRKGEDYTSRVREEDDVC